MRIGAFMATATVLTLLVGDAQALSLTSEDTNERQVRIIVGVDEFEDATVRYISIKPGQTRHVRCDGGCALALENGQIAGFQGHEEVVLAYGRFETLP